MRAETEAHGSFFLGNERALITKTLEIRNRLGLHARAAAKLVHTSSRYHSSVKIRKDGEEVDGKSILGILLLAAAHGSSIELTVEGDDEADACAAVESLFARKFDEDD
jgi:phosphocarrier protein